MDSITHLVAGAAIGEAILGKKVGKKTMLWGALAANAPDIDAVTNFFISDVDALVTHRGITHSVFVAILMGPLLGWLLWRFNRMKEAPPGGWMLLVTVNIFFHLFLDTCTVYGTGLLTPFSDYRYAFDNIFVADPIYTIPLIISCVALLILPRNHHNRFRWNAVGLGLSSMYLIFTFSNHSKAINAIKASAQQQNIQSDEFIATPTLLNNLLWNVVVKDTSGYWLGYYSIFDSDRTPELFFIAENEKLLETLPNQEDIQKLKKFSENNFCVTEYDNKVWFNVIRFGQVNGWDNPHSKFALSYDLSPGADNSMVVQSGRIEASKKEVLQSMWNRMKGN
ncbi:MAG TPA: metal-dependent hydrolase [Bacteroidia bacterium]|nr:metal-dependent hydrolase [Bacteroidia bacterium]